MQLLAGVFGPFDTSTMGMWMFLSVGAVCLFVVFLPLTTYLENRRKEREAFYKADMMRRMAEAPAESSRATLEMMREEERLRRIKQREGLKIGGMVNVGVGVGLAAMLYAIGSGNGVYMVGAIPGFIGVALLVYAFFMAEPV